MSNPSKRSCRKLMIISYELGLIIILMIIQVSNSIQISSSEDSEYFDNITKTEDYIISQVLKRHNRQIIYNGANCEKPSNPAYTIYRILGESEASYKPGDFANQFSILAIRCSKGYALSPFAAKRPICENGKWSEPPTACLRTCSSLISTETTRVKCRYNNIPLENCINPVKGTTAVLSCNPLYEEPNIQRNPVRVCRENRWDPTISECYPICGVKHPKAVPNIINGKTVEVGNYPWQVGIYNSTTKGLLCGGSIISPNIILTAAHCITNYDGSVKPPSIYSVAAGKYYSKYNEVRDEAAQYSNILRIHVPERYTGMINMFALDIAILILSDPFTISQAVQPICIELNGETQYVHLSPNDEGVVTGWGYTEKGRVISDVLKELIIPYISFNQCFNEIPSNFRRYFTQDKFCGGYKNNATSICQGDSGGALAFKHIFSDRYFVKGIVSTSPATEALTCNSNQYSLYTYVDKHIDFIRDVVALNQLNRMLLECVSDDCAEEEYRKLNTKSLNSISSTSKHSGVHVEFDLCGTFSNHLIRNETDVPKGAYPWMGYMFHVVNLSEPKRLCGVSLITTKAALTVGHCVPSSVPVSDLRVRFGVINNENWLDEDIQISNIKKVVLHPNYNYRSADGDIAVLHFSKELVYTHSVRAVCLWDFNNLQDIYGQAGVVVGWKYGTLSKNTVHANDKLQQYHVSAVSEEDCLRSNPSFSDITSDHTFCAGSNNNNEPNTCFVGSGGGFFLYINDRWVIRGITSRALKNLAGHCDSLNYGVYVDVAKYIEWIQTVL